MPEQLPVVIADTVALIAFFNAADGNHNSVRDGFGQAGHVVAVRPDRVRLSGHEQHGSGSGTLGIALRQRSGGDGTVGGSSDRPHLVAALRSRRPLYQVTEPLLRLHHLLIRPHEARLVGRGRARVWAESADLVASLIYGPHLKELARSWCIDHASAETLGGPPSRCEPALVACREHKTSHEIDALVSAYAPNTGRRVLAVGEVKATQSPIGLNQLRRLEHIRTLLPASGGADRP